MNREHHSVIFDKEWTCPRCVENTERAVNLGHCMVLLISVLGKQRQPTVARDSSQFAVIVRKGSGLQIRVPYLLR